MMLLLPSIVAKLRLFPPEVPVTAQPPMMPLAIVTFGTFTAAPESTANSAVPPDERLKLAIGLPPDAPNVKLDPEPVTCTTDAPEPTLRVPTVSVVVLPIKLVMPPLELIA